MLSRCSRDFRRIALAAAAFGWALALAAAPVPGDDAPAMAPDTAAVRDLLEWMPEGADIALALADPADFEARIGALARSAGLTGDADFMQWVHPLFDPLYRLTGIAPQADITTFLQEAGLDPRGGMGLYFDLGEETFGWVHPAADPDKVREALTAAARGGGFVEIPLGEGRTGYYTETPGFGYFLHEGRLALATGTAMLEALAERIDTPKKIRFGRHAAAPADPSAAAILVELARVEERSPALGEWAERFSGLAAHWRETIDEALLTVALDDQGVRLQLLGLNATLDPQQAELPPLELSALAPPNAAGVVNLRLTEGFKEVVAGIVQAVAGDETDGVQATGFLTLFYDIFGDEIVFVLYGVHGGQPMFLAAAPMRNAEQFTTMLPLFGLGDPAEVLSGTPVYRIPDAYQGQTLYLAAGGGIALLAPDLAQIEAILAEGVPDSPEGGLAPAELRARANHGFLHLRGEAVLDIITQTAPHLREPLEGAGVGNLSLVLADDGEWRRIDIALPNFAPVIGRIAGAIADENLALAEARRVQHLSELHRAASLYAAQREDARFPPLSRQPGLLMLAGESVYPQLLPNPALLAHPSGPREDALTELAETDPLGAIDDVDYVYFAHALPDEAALIAFSEAYIERIAEGATLDEDIVAPMPREADAEENEEAEEAEPVVLRRLHLGMLAEAEEGEEETEAEKEAGAPEFDPGRLPVFMERPSAANNGAVMAVFLDGNVRPVARGDYPNTETVALTLEAMDAADGPAPEPYAFDPPDSEEAAKDEEASADEDAAGDEGA